MRLDRAGGTDPLARASVWPAGFKLTKTRHQDQEMRSSLQVMLYKLRGANSVILPLAGGQRVDVAMSS